MEPEPTLTSLELDSSLSLHCRANAMNKLLIFNRLYWKGESECEQYN